MWTRRTRTVSEGGRGTDRVLMVDEGRIVKRGKHEEMSGQNKEMYNSPIKRGL